MKTPRRSVPYPQLLRDRISASMALPYLLDVIAGKVEADPERCRTARWAVDKVVPNPVQQVEQVGEIVVRWKS